MEPHDYGIRKCVVRILLYQGLVTASITLPAARYDEVQRAAFYDRLLDQVRGVPSVVAAGFGSMLPFMSPGNTTIYRVEGREPVPGELRDALFRVTTSDYLRTLGARLVEGRLPDGGDGPDAPPVVVINKSFADLYWPGGTAVGNRIAMANPGAPWMTVIGVVADVHERGYGMALKPAMYPLAPQPGFAADNLVTAFAATALLLASIGIYGLVSFSVTMRRREVARARRWADRSGR